VKLVWNAEKLALNPDSGECARGEARRSTDDPLASGGVRRMDEIKLYDGLLNPDLLHGREGEVHAVATGNGFEIGQGTGGALVRFNNAGRAKEWACAIEGTPFTDDEGREYRCCGGQWVPYYRELNRLFFELTEPQRRAYFARLFKLRNKSTTRRTESTPHLG